MTRSQGPRLGPEDGADREDGPDQLDAPDPVEAMFVAARGQVRDLGAAEGHWQDLVASARRRRPRRWPAYLVGAAAAAAVVAVTVTTLPDRPGTVTEASTTRPQASRTLATGPAGPRALPSGAGAVPIPSGFVMTSISTTSSGRLHALGRATCDGDPCSAVVASDDGQRWSTQTVFADLPLVEDSDQPDAPALDGIRFASDDIGYVFGTTMQRTTDGGRTWQPFEVGDGRVLSVETDQARVWVVSARECSRLECDGPVTVRTADVGDAALQASSAQPALTREVSGQDAAASWAVLDGSAAYLNVFADGEQPQRVGGPVLPRPERCGDHRSMTVVPTASASRTLFAVCATAARDSGEGGFGVAASDDAGQTWSTRSSEAAALGPVRHGGPWVVAPDDNHLVAATGGTVGASGTVSEPSALVHSVDGGRTWSPATTRSGGELIGGSWGWLGTAGGSTVYAMGAGGGYRSDDGGATFAPIDVR